MIYSKTTDLSITAVDPAASLTLMSADIERITTGWQTMHEIWANVLEVGLAIYLLQRQLGTACAIPIAVSIGVLRPLYPLLSLTCVRFPVSLGGSLAATSLVMSRQAMWLEAIERRINATTAMLGAMKSVKMCGLTEILSSNLHGLRLEEIQISRKFRRLLIWNLAFGEWNMKWCTNHGVRADSRGSLLQSRRRACFDLRCLFGYCPKHRRNYPRYHESLYLFIAFRLANRSTGDADYVNCHLCRVHRVI